MRVQAWSNQKLCRGRLCQSFRRGLGVEERPRPDPLDFPLLCADLPLPVPLPLLLPLPLDFPPKETAGFLLFEGVLERELFFEERADLGLVLFQDLTLDERDLGGAGVRALVLESA